MADSLPDYEPADPRPTFITVLCILTFIGSGWGLISESIKYFNADSQVAVISKVREQAKADIQKNKDSANAGKKGGRFAEMMVNSLNMSPANIKKGAIANGVAAIFCLAGAILMWKLKRNGFYFYLVGTLIGIISPFVIFGTDNFLAIISSVMIGFIGLIFVILYGVNLKFMN